jgi:hypothetical protein
MQNPQSRRPAAQIGLNHRHSEKSRPAGTRTPSWMRFLFGEVPSELRVPIALLVILTIIGSVLLIFDVPGSARYWDVVQAIIAGAIGGGVVLARGSPNLPLPKREIETQEYEGLDSGVEATETAIAFKTAADQLLVAVEDTLVEMRAERKKTRELLDHLEGRLVRHG